MMSARCVWCVRMCCGERGGTYRAVKARAISGISGAQKSVPFRIFLRYLSTHIQLTSVGNCTVRQRLMGRRAREISPISLALGDASTFELRSSAPTLYHVFV